jgi:predicted enzyme related to lactoylglutathione lyase
MDLYLIELTVRDWLASLSWYRDRLGLTVLLTDEPNQFALLAAGPARIAIKSGLPVPGSATIIFLVSNLDGEVCRLAGQGVTPLGPIRSSPEGYRVAQFHDPDGYRLDLFEWFEPNPTSAGGV